MAPTPDFDADLKYILLVIKHAEFKPNYQGVAAEAGINNANQAQKRFKKLVENGGFELIKGAVVSPSGSAAVAAPVTPAKTTLFTPAKTTPVAPAKVKAKRAGTPANKKRKVQESEEEDDEGRDEATSEEE